MVCVAAAQPSATHLTSQVTVNGVVVCRAKNFARIGDGGGDGGRGWGTYDDGENYISSGGGGAGGYSGNGGDGGSPASWLYRAPTPGTGGGGGGGGGVDRWLGSPQQQPGGGVGLLGQGASGAPGGNGIHWAVPTPGSPGSGGSGQLYGGGYPSGGPSYDPFYGGALSYKNNVTVTPGQTIAILIGGPAGNPGAGAIRIIWGEGRSFPSTNTGDV